MPTGSLRRRYHLFGIFGEKALFYWPFEIGDTILLRKHGRRLVEFFYICPKLCWMLAGVSFYGPCSTWRACHLDQVILLVWPNKNKKCIIIMANT